MRLLFQHEHEGLWFSKNGHAAYERGERPIELCPKGAGLISSERHHIARKIGDTYTRELVQFYKVSPALNQP